MKVVAAISLFFVISSGAVALSLERLDRGVVAMATTDGHVYVGWRLLASDPPDVGFDVLRSAEARGTYEQLNDAPITDSCNFVDTTADGKVWYYAVRPDASGTGQSRAVRSDPATAGQGYLAIPLQGNYGANKVAIADLDGDGVYDYVIKQPAWSLDPGRQRRSPDTYKIEAYNGRTGRFMWRYDLGWNINLGIWFSPLVAYDFDGDGRAEVALKTAPFAATPEEAFISPGGFVLEGPEYCSILDGMTGEEIDRVDWIARGDPRDWGDDQGNRVNRNQIGVAYLDGKRPSLLVLRGTYTKMRIDAYNLIDKKLRKVWSWSGEDEDPPLRGQGGHTLKAFDIDGDGKDEIIIGSAAIDNDGTCLWRMDMGHPDWFYLANIDPGRPGLEIAYGFETAQPRNGICLVDPRTGGILWGCDHPTTHIHDWGMVADIDPDSPGMEIYGMERDGVTCWLYSAQGKLLARNEDLGRHGPRAFYWLDGPTKVRVPFSYRGGTFPILRYKGPQVGEIQGQPIAIADVLGDWREEVITVTDGVIRIYTTTVPATSRRVCLMQDHLYRMDVAMQAMGYFYPPQLGGSLLKSATGREN
jgi:rhamnogalacturonan endolyase